MARGSAMVSGMDAPPIAMPTSREIAPIGVVMSSAEYAVLTRELESLRASLRSELAQRLHDVRAHGTTSDHDDRLAVLEPGPGRCCVAIKPIRRTED